MGYLTISISLIFLLHLNLPSSAYSLCPAAACTTAPATPVRFPFRLDRHEQPENCGYPGFNLYCTNQGITALTLPLSGEFLVRYISYQTQNIRLYDPQNCLPQRFLDGFDPSSSPFKVESYVNYTFLSCPRNFTDARFTVIDCLSNSTTSIMATSLRNLANKVLKKPCQMIRTLQVPVSLAQNQNDGFTSSLGDDIWLSWDVPDCKDCEVKQGVCGFLGNGSQQIGCSYDLSGSGDSKQQHGTKNLKIFRIIAFSIAIPAIVCALGIGIFLCIMDKRRNSRNSQQITAIPQPQEVAIGLDQATIDSYTKVVLGESGRVPGLNDGSCPICLSDFSSKETLRCIPDCHHCFHADCIDEWLRMNGTCPLCRNSPAHHVQVHSS